jgi:AraC family transcriptional regulator
MKPVLDEGNYYGCCQKSKKAGHLSLSECSYAPNIKIPRHAHQNAYFIFTLSGGQEESFESQTRGYAPGTLAFHPAGEVHCERLGPTGMRALHVEFGSTWIERHPEISRFLENASEFQGGRFGWLAQSVYQEFRCLDDVAPAAIEGLVLEILAHTSRFRSHETLNGDRKWLAQAEELIRARFAEPLSLSGVATAVKVHPVCLARAFRKRFHLSVGEFIRQVRIESACKAIVSGDRLSDVALRVGFADQAHFSRTFKRIVGMSPGQFRTAQAVG